MIHPDIVDIWYNAAKQMIAYEPEASLWDLLRYVMMWEHNTDIEEIIKENLIICLDCGNERKLQARGLCDTCYRRMLRKERKNEISRPREVSTIF